MPLRPEAAAFAEHYGFVIDVLAARCLAGKGRVERQVTIVSDHVLAGHQFASLAELEAAFAGWVPIRRGQVHRPHGELIGACARLDHAALRPLPELPYLVTERHLRRVGLGLPDQFRGLAVADAATEPAATPEPDPLGGLLAAPHSPRHRSPTAH